MVTRCQHLLVDDLPNLRVVLGERRLTGVSAVAQGFYRNTAGCCR